MQHAAESRWQPGRSGGWGAGLEGEDRSLWHMWAAVGGGGDKMIVCVCNGGAIAHDLLSQHPNIMLV